MQTVLAQADAPLVSIIVPVYNAESFLTDCLESLLHQDLKNSEILCVDDGSKDGSWEILQEYARNYPQIRIFHQENAGVSAARNRGIAMAKGQYLCFCDSDDFLVDGILGQAFEKMQQQDARLCYFEMQRVPESYRRRGDRVGEHPVVTRGMSGAVLRNLYVFLLLIRRDLLESSGAAFHTGLAYSEDELFVLDILGSVEPDEVLHLHQVGCIHRKNSGSVMNAPKFIRGPKHYRSARLFALELKKRLPKYSPDSPMHQELLRRRKVTITNALYDALYIPDRKPREILQELKEEGNYPFPFYWEYLKLAEVKTTVSNYLRFLFPIAPYYILLSTTIRFFFRILKKDTR